MADDAGISCTNRKFVQQNDKEQWIIDDSGNPVTPLYPEIFIALGLSIDPADIPAELVDTPVTGIGG
jgi:hypothetical protein